MDTIKDRFPDLIDTEEYIQFECEECKSINGSTIHKDGELSVVVCGNCWHMQAVK